MSKREELRKQRESIKRRERIIIISAIVIVALFITGIVILPSLKPIGNINTITANPRPQAVQNSMGDPKAPVVVEEFSDYQCPYCKKFTEEVEPGIVTQFVATGKVFFTYKPFHLIGAESDLAAQAAYCAGDQGKYWEYHDMLFANQTGEEVGDFTQRRLVAFADKLGLDSNALGSCLSSGKYAQQIQKDTQEGQAKGISATPTFLVNGNPADMGNLATKITEALTALGK